MLNSNSVQRDPNIDARDFLQQDNKHLSLENTYPISFNQQSMWLLQQLSPETANYNIGFSFHIRSALNGAHMQQALQQVVNRHEVLRTIYPLVEGSPVQAVLAQQAVVFEQVEASSWSEDEIKQAVDNYYHQPFDLLRDNVLRVRLYTLGEAHFLFQAVVHHIAVDAWSIWLLMDEVSQNYVVLQSGKSFNLKPLRNQYADFVKWQRDFYESEEGRSIAEFWKEELSGKPPRLNLPETRDQSEADETTYDWMQFVIEPQLVTQIHEIAHNHGVTTYSFLLAVFQLLLSKYSDQQDILVSTPAYGRGSLQFARSIGYFINPVPLRGDINADYTFATFLEKTGEKVQAVLANQQYPFAELVKQLRPSGGEPDRELLQVMFNLFKPPNKFQDIIPAWLDESGDIQIEKYGLTIERVKMTGNGLGGVELYLEIIDFREQLIGRFGFDQALFQPSTVSSMVSHFQQLLKNIVEDPDQPLVAYRIPKEDFRPTIRSEKLDHKALPERDAARSILVQPYVEPRTSQERLLAEVWASVLQVDRVGVHDNFFILGGHSLLATQLISRMERATGVMLPLRTLFEKPTIAGVTLALDQARRGSITTPPPILPVDRSGEIPLSFSQERMWFLHQLAPDDHAYTIPVAMKFEQTVNHKVIQKSFDALVERHESLRTIFPTKDGVPRQKILPPFPAEITEIDLSSVAAAEQEATVIKLIQADMNIPFELTNTPPWRINLFRLNEHSYVFYLAFHHIIFDLWSTVVLWQDFQILYDAYLKDETASLKDMEIHYADFSVWQRNRLQGEVLEDLLSYWRKQLNGLPELAMPTDHPRPPVQSYHGATEIHYLPESLTESLRALSREAQVSPFMLILAAFKILLGRYSGQVDIAVGVPVANRQYLSTEPLIGTFVNTLVIRSDLSRDPTFAQFLTNTRDVLLDAYAHQELPFEKLVSEIVQSRDLSRTPLVQILFDMANPPFDYDQASASPISFLIFDRGAAQFDISINVAMEENLPVAPHIAVEYNTTLYEQKSIQCFLTHYEALLSAVTANPGRPISEYDILNSEEKKLLLKDWNKTQAPYPKTTLHTLFMEQVSATPENKAVSFKDQVLTYQALDERSNKLAHFLQSRGVGPETIVGIYLERSADMIVALLGVLKAGGAFLPLDPDFPDQRLAFMIEDTGTEIILTQADLLDSPPIQNKKILPLCLDADWPEIDRQPDQPLADPAAPENCAYIIYTSGSTGKPKGVQVEHRNVVNFITAMQQKPGISSEDILLHITTLSFDISILEIFLPLLNGAQIVIADRLEVLDKQKLSALINQSKVTFMQATPTTWRMLIDGGWQGSPSLKKALCGGEALSHDLADALLACDLELWNMYGPTETTVWSTVQQISADGNRITIGRPINNTACYVLDAQARPVPIGVAGELYIGGDGVARGYLNRPDITAEKYLPDPYTEWSSTGRFYRTGDLVQYLSDGSIKYLGRIDFQVKIRGHRIEPGEIENALFTHPQVRDVVVTIKQDQQEPMLAAYIIAQDQDRPTTTSLQNHLRQTLPQYMIPSAFVFLEAFPQTPNRKIDRRALPSPNKFRPDLDNRFVAPRDDLEKVLASILADLLGLEEVGIHDDFFELGGHSLQATRYVSRVSQALRTELSLWLFLQAPNVADFAAALSRSADDDRIKRIAQLRVKMAAMSPDEMQQLQDKFKDRKFGE